MAALYDGGLYEIKPGMIIAYRLLPEDMPANPLKVWHGKVKVFGQEVLVVEILEVGYSNLTEVISYEQIVAVSESEVR